MDGYGAGMLIAFLMWLWRSVMLIASLNSTYERNLRKVGQRLSWGTLLPKPIEAGTANRSWPAAIGKYLLIVGFGLPFIFLSWLTVALHVGMFAYRKSKDSGVPQGVKEFRWKMKNIEMSLDQIITESMRAAGEDPAKFDETKAELLAELKNRGLAS